MPSNYLIFKTKKVMKYFIPMLALLFIALKLTHVIAWS
jgi:hypothetical protein